MKIGFREQSLTTEVQSNVSSLSRKCKVGEDSRHRERFVLVRKVIAFSVILICFFFLGKILYHNLGEISVYQWKLKPSFLVLSFLLLIVNLTISAYAWKRTLLLFGARLPFDRCFKIMFVSGLGRYLPGKIWPYLSQIYLSGKEQIQGGVTLLSVLLLFGISSLVGVFVFIYSLFFWEKFSSILVSVYLLLFSAFLLIIISHRVLNRILRTFASISNKFKPGWIPEKVAVRGGITHVGEIILIFIINWIVFGAAVYLLVNSFHYFDISQTLILCGIFAISVISGIFSFFVPAGLGVREGILSYLLSSFVPISTAVVISMLMRVWMTLGELVCFFIALKVKRPKLL